MDTNWASKAKITGRAAAVLKTADQVSRGGVGASPTTVVRKAPRAKILFGYHAGENFSVLRRRLRVSRRTVLKHVDRALAAGGDLALRDAAWLGADDYTGG